MTTILSNLAPLVPYPHLQREELMVPNALGKLDTSGILFFFGILLSVGALESSGLLVELAQELDSAVRTIGS